MSIVDFYKFKDPSVVKEFLDINKQCNLTNSHDRVEYFEEESHSPRETIPGEESLSPPKEDDSLKKAAKEILLLFKQEKDSRKI